MTPRQDRLNLKGVATVKIGTLRCHDVDDNEKVKKAIG